LHGSVNSTLKASMLAAVALAAVALALQGCSNEEESAIPYQPIVDTRQFMEWILDPMADVIWGSAGTISTLEGVEDLAPTTQEGWDAVRNAAAALAEMGNLLMVPGHSREGDWNEIARGLTDTSVLLIKAAENKDDQQVFDYGGQLYNVCVSCHQLYPPEPE
jgi:hypothetical protein